MAFYKLACFSKHIESVGSADKFFQQTLSVSTVLDVSSKVEISALQSVTQYNGMVATVVSYDSSKDRWVLRLPRSTEIMVKTSNLMVESHPPGGLTQWGTPARYLLKAGEEPRLFSACAE